MIAWPETLVYIYRRGHVDILACNRELTFSAVFSYEQRVAHPLVHCKLQCFLSLYTEASTAKVTLYTPGPWDHQDLSSGVWKCIPMALRLLRALIAIGNASFHNTSGLSRGAVRAEPAILNPSQKKSMEVDVDGNTITCLTYLKGRGLNMILHMATHGWVGS